ncbi:MAG TPA: ribosome recycling factor [Chitinophagaceae bacterium]|jgi:ribosome recycling factor|nr:ribosome recycling factor [Chitinophagaceae bacterium]
MEDDILLIQEETKENMRKGIQHLESELIRIRAGKASPDMLDGIMVDYYDNPTPINQVANVSVVDARTLSLQPWEKPMLQAVEKAIMAANIGVTPQNDGQLIRLFLPPLTEERRRELVKRVNAEGEHAKITIRNLRRDAMEQVKKLQKDGLSKDAAKNAENDIQQLTDTYIGSIDKRCASKEKEIMVV